MPKKHPSDVNQLAKHLTEQATNQQASVKKKKNPAAVALGRLGGKKGGVARAQKLSSEQRAEIARKAAAKRWSKKP